MHLQDSTNKTCQKGALQPSRHVRTQAVLWALTFALQCCGRHQFPYQVNTVKPRTCLWASTMLWAPIFAVRGEHSKTPYMRLA